MKRKMTVQLLILSIIILYLLSIINNSTFFTLLLVLLSVSLFYFLLLDTDKKISLNFKSLILIGFLLSYILPVFYLTIRSYSNPNIDVYNTFSENNKVILLTNIGAYIFTLAYNLPNNRRTLDFYYDKIIKLKINRKSIITFCIVLFSVIIISRFLIITNGVYYWVHNNEKFLFGQYFSILANISNFGPILPILFGLIFIKTGKFKLTTILLFIIELVWIFPSGARYYIISLLFSAYIIIWFNRKKIPLKLTLILSLITIFIMASLNDYRNIIKNYSDVNQINLYNVSSAIENSFYKLEESYDGMVINSLDNFFQRLYDGKFFGFLLKNYANEYEFEIGRTYYTRLPNLLVPYFIWQHKEIMQVPLNDYYKLLLYGSNPLTLLGESYVNFGILGILIIPFIFGLIVSYLERFLLRKVDNILIFSLTFWLMSNLPFTAVHSFMSILGLFRNVIIFLIIISIIDKYFNFRKKINIK